MEFWGVEIEPGQTLKVEPGEDKHLHLSQASLGEAKANENDNTLLYVTVDNQKLVLGTLSAEKCAQIQFDLVFEKEFQLYHNSKSASVYFCGYKTVGAAEDDFFSDSEEGDSDSDQAMLLLDEKANGKPSVKKEQAKSTAEKTNAMKSNVFAGKAKPKVEAPKKTANIKENDDEDDDDDDMGFEEDDESDEDDDEDTSESEDDSEESSDEEEAAVVKKPELSKKRKADDSSVKAPVPEKKAKAVTPGPDQKKGVPYKKGDKSKQQSPKSGGSFSCKSCDKNFVSDNALQSHAKAKHSAGK